MNNNLQPPITLPISDRAIQYGDGCFTTLAVHNGEAELCASHIQRLQTACERLYLPFTQWQALTDDIAASARQMVSGVVKVLISRGSGGRGYDPTNVQHAHYVMTTHDLPSHYLDWQQQGIELGLSNITLAKQPLLAGIKHLNRLEQVLIKRDQLLNQRQEVLVTDTDGMMVEVSAANIFWCRNGVWYTPDLTFCGVQGVMRNHVINMLKGKNINVLEVREAASQLASASAVFITNSLMRIVPVTQFNGARFNNEQVKQFQQWLSV